MGRWRLLLFGASGAIGGAVDARARALGWQVITISRTAKPADAGMEWRIYDPLADDGAAFSADAPFDAVCWAHGANMADSVQNFDAERHMELYRANCLSVIMAMSMLSRESLLAPSGARLVVVSSFWQERARADKLSYTVSKAAVGGLVRAASVDLGEDGHLVNGVLPGVLDTPMTRANLSPAQVAAVGNKTSLGRLPDLATVAGLICFLSSPENKSINGQSISVDLGMNYANLI